MKVIIFDIDNTLITWKKEFIFALKNVLNEMGYNYDVDTINKIDAMISENEKHFVKLEKETLLKFINDNCNTNLPPLFIDKLITAQSDCIYPDKDLILVMEYLSKKYDLYAISNWFTETQKNRLAKMGIIKYFKDVIGADINYFKPDKRVFDMILKKYKPEDCISIGDSLENDVLLPISLGMQAIWKTNEESSEYQTIKNINDLKELL